MCIRDSDVTEEEKTIISVHLGVPVNVVITKVKKNGFAFSAVGVCASAKSLHPSNLSKVRVTSQVCIAPLVTAHLSNECHRHLHMLDVSMGRSGHTPSPVPRARLTVKRLLTSLAQMSLAPVRTVQGT